MPPEESDGGGPPATEAPFGLTVSTASGGAELALLQGGAVVAVRRIAAAHGLAAALPLAAAELLRGWPAPGLIAAVTGPGSFTGLRAGLALAQGLAAGFGVALAGISVADALRFASLGTAAERAVWVAMAARAGHVFIDTGDALASHALPALPRVTGRIAVAGDAANVVAATLAARGTDVMLLPQRVPRPVDVWALAVARLLRGGETDAALPLYGEEAMARPAPPRFGLGV